MPQNPMICWGEDLDKFDADFGDGSVQRLTRKGKQAVGLNV